MSLSARPPSITTYGKTTNIYVLVTFCTDRCIGTTSNKNGVGVLIDRSLKDCVVEVRRQGDRIILVKLVISDVLNVISAYAPK